MLTDQYLQTLVAVDKPIKKSDGGGLHICAMPLGRKRWRLVYRFGGKQKTIDGGEYPAVSLHRARVWREEMKELIANGVDPIDHEQQAKFEAAAEKVTFAMFAREWMEARRPAWSPRYARLIEGRLEHDILPVLGDKPVRSILPRTVLEALRVIEARDSYEMAHRVKNHCSEIFRFGIQDGRCEFNRCRDLSTAMIKPPSVRHRAKIEIRDLPEFYARLNANSGSKMSHLALLWTILNMVRTQETRFTEWAFRSRQGHPTRRMCSIPLR